MFATANGTINERESLLKDLWQVRIMLNSIGAWALLATVIVLDGECCISEEQFRKKHHCQREPEFLSWMEYKNHFEIWKSKD